MIYNKIIISFHLGDKRNENFIIIIILFIIMIVCLKKQVWINIACFYNSIVSTEVFKFVHIQYSKRKLRSDSRD